MGLSGSRPLPTVYEVEPSPLNARRCLVSRIPRESALDSTSFDTTCDQVLPIFQFTGYGCTEIGENKGQPIYSCVSSREFRQ